MNKFFAAAAAIAFGSMGIACASEGPAEDDTVIIDAPADAAQADLSKRPQCSPYALQATKFGVKAGQRFQVRFACDAVNVADCAIVNCTLGGGEPAPAPAPKLPAAKSAL